MDRASLVGSLAFAFTFAVRVLVRRHVDYANVERDVNVERRT